MIDIAGSVKANTIPVSEHKKPSATDAEYFFMNDSYLDAYIQLLDGIRQHRRLLLLTGDAGVGKTLLLRKLINELPINIKSAVCYSSHLDFDDLLASINDQLGIIPSDGEFSSGLDTLKKHFNDYIMRGTDVALFIDDAHHLKKDILNDVLNLPRFECTGGGTVQVVLSGTLELEEILIGNDFREDLSRAVRVYLEPLVASDIADYILRQAQYTDSTMIDSMISPPVIEGINKYTGGVPRLISVLCEHALMIAKIRGQTTISVDIIDEAAGDLILKEKNPILLPDLDFDPLEMTHSSNIVQVEKMEQLLDHEDLMSDQTQSLAIRPLWVDEPERYSSPIIRWDDHQTENGHSRPFNFAGAQLALLVFLALLAGMFGGMGGVYMYQRILAQAEPSVPISAPVREMAALAVSAPKSREPSHSESAAPIESEGETSEKSLAAQAEPSVLVPTSIGMAEPLTASTSESEPLPPSKSEQAVLVSDQKLSVKPEVEISKESSAVQVEPKASDNRELPVELETKIPEKPLEPSPTPLVSAGMTQPDEKRTSSSAASSSTMTKPLDASAISSYMSNGDLFLERGDVASARLFYQEAANAGWVEAMVAVGKTYDPVMLAQLGIKGFYPDPVKAAEWYLKAKEKADDPQSIERLQALKRWLSNSSTLGEVEASTLQQLLE